jgi:peptidoglycan hydrolase-like protein with peptidoglycan-binding domain
MEGEDIVAIQQLLITAGFPCGASGADGKYGAQTDAAFAKFKVAKGIIPNPEGTPPQTEHFKASEWRCKDGRDVPAKYYADLFKLMQLLEELRKSAGNRAVLIISGYRSPEYNAALAAKSDGVAEHSLHMYGKAADIKIPGLTPSQVYDLAYPIFRHHGIHKYGSFVHVDVGAERRW